MAFRVVQSFVPFALPFMILGFLSCGGSTQKAWEKGPEVLVSESVVLPTANNYRPVLEDAFFFVVNLKMYYGEALMSIDGESIELTECEESPGIYDVPDLFKLYEKRKEQEGGHADIVFAFHPDIPMNLVQFLIREFRLRGVFQFHFRITPSDGSKVDFALMQQQFSPYSDQQLRILSASFAPICNHREEIPGNDTLLSVESLEPFSTFNPSKWDTVANGGTGRIGEFLKYPAENDVWILADGRSTIQGDTFGIGGLGNHLRRMQDLSDTPIQTLVGVQEDANYGLFIAALDQLIMSGLTDYQILSSWEMQSMSAFRNPSAMDGSSSY